MRLSEAMMLGDSLRERNPSVYLADRGEGAGYCGCAIGGAQLAVGDTSMFGYENIWPWLLDGGYRYDVKISIYFIRVHLGERTFEQLVDYVRSVEPDCGDCCKFECSCVQKMDNNVEEKEVVHV
jgi:hypothetical protein